MSIEENIETVVSTFQKGRELAESGLSVDELISKLYDFEPRYRSVAFEGATFGLGATQKLLTLCQFLSSIGERHTTQVAIGLGWAIVEADLHLSFYSALMPEEKRVKILDGIGFYYSMHSRSATIRRQEIPNRIKRGKRAGFDQGVGRAIWYITKGDIAKVVNIINHFTKSRKPNLWQGIGVASTYVGGCSDELIAELKSAAGKLRPNLEMGIDAAEESMRKAQA